jgi:pyruvate ferredoxin oxidoreductase delta subunit
MCWIFCPEAAIKVNPDGSYEVEYMYCKGCGICEKACAVKAIKMEEEKR